MENNLYSLCKKFNTDKLELGYVELYESYFKPLREKKLNILEIGVFRGGSLNTWSDYYFNSNVLGIDIDQNCKVYEKGEKIKVEIGSQFDEKFLKHIVNQYGLLTLL